MSYVTDMLAHDERIVYQAATSKIAYINAILVLAALLEPTGILRLASTELTLTDKRVIGRAGIFGRKKLALKVGDIESVHVRQGLLGRFLDFGTVIITAKDGERVAFKGILWPLVFQQEVDEAIEVAVLGRKLSDYAPNL